MLYFDDDRLNQAIRLLGWAGKQSPVTSEDYLMVVDANLGNKSNNSILRGLTYDVGIADDGSLNNRLSVVYDYAASRASRDPAVDPEHHGRIDYGNLMQVFVAQGSQLVSTNFETSQSTTVVEHPDTTAFVSTVLVPYDTSQRFQFTYTTPPLAQQIGSFRRYRLNLQKQPGMEQEPVSVQVVLPRNAVFVSSSPEPAARFDLDSIVLEYRLILTADQRLEIVYKTN